MCKTTKRLREITCQKNITGYFKWLNQWQYWCFLLTLSSWNTDYIFRHNLDMKALMDETVNVKGVWRCTRCGHEVPTDGLHVRQMDRWYTDSPDSMTNPTDRKVQINLGAIQRRWVVAGWENQVLGWMDRWWMEEMGANAFGSSWAAGIDRAMLYGMRCIANAAKWRGTWTAAEMK